MKVGFVGSHGDAQRLLTTAQAVETYGWDGFFARESVAVDHLSGGRLVMPVGLGVQDDGGFGRVI